MYYSALTPVSDAVYARLQASPDLVAAAVGGIWDDVPQNPVFPFVNYEVQSREQRGLGVGSLPEIELRTSVWSEFGGVRGAQEINRLIIAALRDQPIPIDPTLYVTCGWTVHDDSIPLPDTELNGIKVHTLVSIFRIYVEEIQP